MRITLITACYNSVETIGDTFKSVARQNLEGNELEYIIMDGGSTDGTVEAIKAFAEKVPRKGLTVVWQSEKDKGLYDAINKGIAKATGDVVGILNADDIFEDEGTLAAIAAEFTAGVEAVYADIRFVKELGGPTVRYCSARHFSPWMFRFGVMIPHPSFYCRREKFAALGGYSLDYRICADFELVLRFLGKNHLKAKYLPRCVVTMRMGGLSTAGIKSTLEINREDLRALKSNGYWSAMPLLYLRYFFKIWGFLFH